MSTEWMKIPWHCSICGEEVQGRKMNDVKIKAECRKCGAVMVRSLKKAKSDVIQIFPPKENLRKAN